MMLLSTTHHAFLLVVTLLAVVVEGHSRGDNIGNSGVDGNKKNDGGVLSIPLIPHHVQKRRRALELAQQGEEYYEEHDQNSNNNDRGRGWRRRVEDDEGAGGMVSRADQIGALYLGYGTHYVDLWCGTPAQRQTVIVDTGSAITGFPCEGCHDCGELKYHIDDLFRYDKSSTFHKYQCNECPSGRCENNECRTSLSYQEGSSWGAFEARDLCYVGGPHGEPLEVPSAGTVDATGVDGLDPAKATAYAFDLTFGCQTRLTGLFKTQLADGILGMDNAHDAFWRQMINSGKVDAETFALCFARYPHAERDGTEAGAMSLGGFDTRLHKTPLVYTKTNAGSGFYNIQLKNVYLREGGGGVSAKSSNPALTVHKLSSGELSSGRNIVDSGTTDTYITGQVRTEFMRVYKEITGQTYDHRGTLLSTEQMAALPTVLLQLQGDVALNKVVSNNDPNSVAGLAGDLDPANPYDVILAIPPEHYMEYDEDTNKHVARIYLEEYSTVLGANAMMGHDVVFDVKNSNVGWAESDCAYVELLEKHGYDKSAAKNVSYNGDHQIHSTSAATTTTTAAISSSSLKIQETPGTETEMAAVAATPTESVQTETTTSSSFGSSVSGGLSTPEANAAGETQEESTLAPEEEEEAEQEILDTTEDVELIEEAEEAVEEIIEEEEAEDTSAPEVVTQIEPPTETTETTQAAAAAKPEYPDEGWQTSKNRPDEANAEDDDTADTEGSSSFLSNLEDFDGLCGPVPCSSVAFVGMVFLTFVVGLSVCIRRRRRRAMFQSIAAAEIELGVAGGDGAFSDRFDDEDDYYQEDNKY